ncbi:MAG: Bax inhibitor-1/YccA family protein [Bacteroidia bacterium]|nr:Bax inhibitor-1/YccA family protein [Bacteroidia bacterium]MDW8334959.1 Bax inhibitor-1/YccA family protein [Bacteroidia bacterium]
MENQFGVPIGQSRALQAHLSAFVQKVFVAMGAALAITALSAYLLGGYFLANEEALRAMIMSPMRWVIMLLPFAFVLVLSFGITRLSYAAATIVFALYAVSMGVSLSFIFVIYTTASIASTFVVAAGMFIATGLYGMVTKRDLSRLGSILMMALFGLVIAGLVNMFLASSALSLALTLIGIVIFCGLTAWEMQRIKEIGLQVGVDDSDEIKKMAIIAALGLYLNFINLFLYLLRLMGDRR